MPLSQPSSQQIITAVRSYLETTLLPQLQGRESFDTRVAVNALKTVEREHSYQSNLDQSEIARLKQLLNNDSDDLLVLNDDLCGHIASGDITLDNAEFVDHLYKTTQGKLQIDNPRYSTYQDLVASEG